MKFKKIVSQRLPPRQGQFKHVKMMKKMDDHWACCSEIRMAWTFIWCFFYEGPSWLEEKSSSGNEHSSPFTIIDQYENDFQTQTPLQLRPNNNNNKITPSNTTHVVI